MSAVLNETTEKTKRIIHLLVTSLCDRNCPHCCNKQYDLNEIPYVTADELKEAEFVCITGGEPFKYSNPNAIAKRLKQSYPNIIGIYVYTNAIEFGNYLLQKGRLTYIDGVNVSIKNHFDADVFDDFIVNNAEVESCSSNRLYVFNDLYSLERPLGNFEYIDREWQTEFVPADDSIFRKI